ncbi:MAG: ABC transporter permease [Robiginitomaculum sp.]
MSTHTDNLQNPYKLIVNQGQLMIKVFGDWNLRTINTIENALSSDLSSLGNSRDFSIAQSERYEMVVFDFSGLNRMDTAGAYILMRAIGCHDGHCRQWQVTNATKGQKALVSVAAKASKGMMPSLPKPWYEPIERLGKGASNFIQEGYNTLSFFGEFVVISFKLLINPRRIRWKSVVSHIETIGLDALPIVSVLSFFIGAVIAFMGADLLANFGASVYVVDLVGVSVLREFAVLIMAILLAGRSNSSFTAQIGAMKMRQEVDALKVIGMDINETLVAPRAIACLISAPILTFIAMVSGLLGGLLVAWSLGISPILFTARITEVIDIKHFWVGMAKAPVFALVVAIIGCRQGLAVRGSVESLGRRTTVSVVQAIFTIIVLDAMFALLFLKMGV